MYQLLPLISTKMQNNLLRWTNVIHWFQLNCRCIYQNSTDIVKAVNVIERYQSIIAASHLTISVCNVGKNIEATLQQILNRLDQRERGSRHHKKPCHGCNSWALCPYNKQQLERGTRQHKKTCYGCNSTCHLCFYVPWNSSAIHALPQHLQSGCNSTRHLWFLCPHNKRKTSTEQRSVSIDSIS